MDSLKKVQLLYSIASEVERSLEMPVILFTIKDYATSAVDSLVKLRAVLLGAEPSDRILAIVSAFHFSWLQAVKEVEDFKYRARETPRAHVLEAIDFTVESVKNREINFRKFIETLTPTMTIKDNRLLQDILNCIGGTVKNLVAALNDKYKCINSAVDQIEYQYKVLDETEELLDWLDMLHDNLAIQVSKFVDILLCPKLTSNLSEILQKVIDEVTTEPDQQALDIAKEFKSKSKNLSSCLNLTENAGANKILEKIKILEDRLDKLKNKNSCAVLALEHKTIYLEQRIQSLENLKKSLFKLTCMNKENAWQKKDIRIFNHLLPHSNRIHLVNDLLKLWTEAICRKPDRKSIDSIFSKRYIDASERFSDAFGKFIIDFYGRKLYVDKEGKMFQLSFNNELVPLVDDDEHIYFYDEWGRYFINDKMQRIYKLHKDASEYCLQQGLLYLIKEIRDGREYWCDNLGRYYIDEVGKRIYCEDGGELYENDGFDNLVRIRNVDPVIQKVCPAGRSLQMEENRYLQRVVGVALRKCIARVVMQQPTDPVQFLASCLEEYARCECERQRHMRDPLPSRRHAPLSSTNESLTDETTSTADSNLLHYLTPYLSDSFI